MRRLSKREKMLGIGLAIFVAGWLVLVYLISPANHRIDTLSRVIPEKQKQLVQIEELAGEYSNLQNQLDQLHEKAISQQQFELLTYLESQIGQLGLVEKVATMKRQVAELNESYSQIVVELQMENIALKELVDFLVQIKSSDHFLQIKSLYTTDSSEAGDLLDAVIQISTIKPANSA